MTDPAAGIDAAERRATAARERLSDDLHKLQVKLNPKTLASSAARSAADAGKQAARSAADRGRAAALTAADRGQVAASQGLDFARANPAPVAGAAAVTGLFLLRHRIARLFSRKPKVRAQSRAKPAHLTPSDQKDFT